MKKIIILSACLAIATSLWAINYFSKTNRDVACQKNARPPIDYNSMINMSFSASPIDIHFKIGTRFIHHTTKEELMKATKVSDFFSGESMENVKGFYRTQAGIVQEPNDQVEYGDEMMLTEEQLKLLQSLDYSDNFYVRADIQLKEVPMGHLDSDYVVYYRTVVPEKQAQYKGDLFTWYEELKSGARALGEIYTNDILKPAMISFLINERGEMTNIELERKSGYDSLDKFTLKALQSLEEKWKPAQNAKGEFVPQKLHFAFGEIGC